MTEFEELVIDVLMYQPDEWMQVCYKTKDGTFKDARAPRDVAIEAINKKVASGAEIDMWFGVNPVGRGAGRAKGYEVTRVAACYLDLDFKAGALGSPKNAAMLVNTLVEELDIKYCALYHTGGGLQLYVPVAPTDEVPVYEVQLYLKKFELFAMQRALELDLGAIDPVADLSRILRVPGSRNQKPEYVGKPEVFRVYGAMYTAQEDSVRWISQSELDLMESHGRDSMS